MSDLAELLERVKAAPGPDREIDRWIQLLVANEGRLGRFKSCEAWIEACRSQRWATPFYTRSLDTILPLMEGKLSGWHYEQRGVIGGKYHHAELEEDVTGVIVSGTNAPTPALALLAAFLAAKIAQPTP